MPHYGCYCSSLDFETCEMVPRFEPNGACAAEIRAAFPANMDPSFITFGATDVRYPSGGALAFATCDEHVCPMNAFRTAGGQPRPACGARAAGAGQAAHP
jgi:hypothetical protein